MNWIQVTNPDTHETSFVDLAELDGATRVGNGTITLWTKSGRVVCLSGCGAWMDEAWALFEKHTGLQKLKPWITEPVTGIKQYNKPL